MKKKANSFDQFIERLSVEFSKINNFHLFNDDENGQKLFNFIAKRFAEIHSYKILFLNSYLPAASKASVESWNDFQNSKYKKGIQVSKEDFKDNYFETIRLGYIGMFHKYENYIEDLIQHAELISGSNSYKSSLPEYLLRTFGFRINDWKQSPIISRLNWISNCNKHYDGYPRKMPVPDEFSNCPTDQKLKLNKEDFVRDIDFLISEYLQMLQLVFQLAMHRMVFEGRELDVNNFSDSKLKEDFIGAKQKLDESLRSLLEFRKTY